MSNRANSGTASLVPGPELSNMFIILQFTKIHIQKSKYFECPNIIVNKKQRLSWAKLRSANLFWQLLTAEDNFEIVVIVLKLEII